MLISFEPNEDISVEDINFLINNSLDIGRFGVIESSYLDSHPEFDLLKWIQDGLQDLQYIEDRRKQLQVDKLVRGYRG